jgi:hypothetical protein
MRALFTALVLVCALLGPAAARIRPDGSFALRGMDEIPAPGERPCRAIRHGETVNTRLLRSNADRMVLIASWHTWSRTEYPVSGSFAIDGGQPVAVIGYSIGPLFMVRIDDPLLHQALRDARTLTWRLPWGDFTADVTGLGAAFDALAPCPGDNAAGGGDPR